MKLEMLATLGRWMFKLKELCPGLTMDAELAEKEFLVPSGHLSASHGQGDANEQRKGTGP